MFGSWVLNKIRIMDLSSALVGKLMSSFKLLLFRTKLIFTQVYCLLYTICTIYMYKQFAFRAFILLFPEVVVVSVLNKYIGGSTDLLICSVLHTLQFSSVCDFGRLCKSPLQLEWSKRLVIKERISVNNEWRLG